MGPRRVTLVDVARAAGVSVQTASHVLSGSANVRIAAETRRRVLEAADKVGYVPNRLAQAMKTGKTQVVAVWMPLDRVTPTYQRFLKTIHDAVAPCDYELMVVGLERMTALQAKGRPPNPWPVDGIISMDAGKALLKWQESVPHRRTPSVVLGYEAAHHSDGVGWDVVGAVRTVTERLLAEGRKKVAHLTLDWILADFPNERRRRGYTEAMAAAGLEPILIPVSAESSIAAESALLAYADEHGWPDAVTSFTDTLGYGAVRAALAQGRKVPEDIAVWGYGDYPSSEDFRVPLSSIQLPIPAIIDQAWTWLQERIDGASPEYRLAELPMELIPRDSG